jgi:Na+/H+ antiporter NhaD/arsenite permease-like protein
MVGDPPNILIGSATPFTFVDFVFNLTPPVILTTLASLLLIVFLYRNKTRVSNENRARLLAYREENLIKNRRNLVISAAVVVCMLVALALESVHHLGTATISMSAGLFLLAISSRRKVEHILVNDIDWVTLFFFIGLFMIVESLVETGFIDKLADGIVSRTGGEARPTSMAILWLSGLLSALIDNVPFVTAMIPMIEKIGNLIPNHGSADPIWWSLALGTCLGGNGTLIGASANIVAVGIAKRNGFRISFLEYTRIGALFTFVSLAISAGYILLRYF